MQARYVGTGVRSRPTEQNVTKESVLGSGRALALSDVARHHENLESDSMQLCAIDALRGTKFARRTSQTR